MDQIRDDIRRRGILLPSGDIGAYRARSAAQREEEGNAKLAVEMRQRCSAMIGFTEYRYSRYVTATHHRIVAHALEGVERREYDHLIIEMPPRHGKSELASKSYPAWCLGRNPAKQIISASADNRLAVRFGRYVRNIVGSEPYRLVFPGVQLAEDSNRAGLWETKQGGAYISASVGSAIMGSGADEYLIDDPYGSMENARSETIRDNVWEWFDGNVYNRLQPRGAIIVIAHRMHEDDLAGRLIERMKAGGDKWKIVSLRAIAEAPSDKYPEPDPMGRPPGTALWPAAYPIKALERIRANTLARNWSALYQQKPVPDEGAMFLPDKITVRANMNTSDVVV